MSARDDAPVVVQNTYSPAALAEARQLVVVVTPGWNAVSGTLRRFSRHRGALVGMTAIEGPHMIMSRSNGPEQIRRQRRFGRTKGVGDDVQHFVA